MKLDQIKINLRSLGLTIRKTDGEFRVAFRGNGHEDSAYYTDDLQDAYDTGRQMARWKGTSVTASAKRIANKVTELEEGICDRDSLLPDPKEVAKVVEEELENERNLVDKLLQYVRHKKSCSFSELHPSCNCGLRDWLLRYTEVRKRG